MHTYMYMYMDIYTCSHIYIGMEVKKKEGHLLLFTAGLDGDVIVYDAENEYVPLKTLSAVPAPSECIRMALSTDQK
jgi:hypothetical protein